MKEQEAERLAKSTRGKKKKPAKENTQAKKRTKGDTDVILADILTEDDFRGPRSEPVTGEEVGEAESAAAPPATATAAEKDTYSRKLADGRAISDRQPALIVGAVLREYQLVGVEWLKVRRMKCTCGHFDFFVLTFVCCFVALLFAGESRAPKGCTHLIF